MLKRPRVCSLVFLVALAVLCSPTRLVAAEGGTDRPFRGSAVGVVTDQIPPNGLVIDYTGKATHLGRFTRREFVFFYPDGSFFGTMVFTAANGDRLTLDFT